MKQTNKDNELLKLMDKYPRPKGEDIDIVIETLLNWEEQSSIWLFFVTQILESSEITSYEEKKERLQKLKDTALEDENLSKEFNELLAKAQEPSDEDKINKAKFDRLEELGFKRLLEEDDVSKLISKTDWKELDYNHIQTAYMLFDGDLTLSEQDAEILHHFPIIITGNLTIEGNLTELPYSGILMIFGDLHTKNLFLWESILYVQGTLFAEQAVILSTGDYISQINSIQSPLLVNDGKNATFGNHADVIIDYSGNYQDLEILNKVIQENLLEEYYTIGEDDYYYLDYEKTFEALKQEKSVLKINK